MPRPQVRMKYKDRQSLISGVNYYLAKTTYQPERLGYIREMIDNNLDLIRKHIKPFRRAVLKHFDELTASEIDLYVFMLWVERGLKR